MLVVAVPLLAVKRNQYTNGRLLWGEKLNLSQKDLSSVLGVNRALSAIVYWIYFIPITLLSFIELNKLQSKICIHTCMCAFVGNKIKQKTGRKS